MSKAFNYQLQGKSIKKKPRLFTMYRKNDESGVSGTGRVLDGVVFQNGITVVCWLTAISSISQYDSFDHFKAIHMDRHPSNKSELVWLE